MNSWRHFRHFVLPWWTGLGLVTLAWAALPHGASRIVVPLPIILTELWAEIARGHVLTHSIASLRIICAGLTLATVIGTLLGVILAESDTLARIIFPVIDALRGVAALALLPLLIVLFGLGEFPRMLVIAWTTWPVITLTSAHAIQAIDPYFAEAANLDGASKLQVLYYIRAPLALPAWLTAVRVGVSSGWISLIAAEMLGAQAGLGYAVLHAGQTFNYPRLWAYVLLIMGWSLGINHTLLWLQRHVDRVLHP